MDILVSIAEFHNRIRVTFRATMSNAIPERRLLFHCSEGTVDLDLYQQRIRYKNLGDEGITELNSTETDGGGDSLIMVELYKTMVTGSEPVCSGSEGLESAIYALAVDQAARTGEIVNLESVWRSLDRLN